VQDAFHAFLAVIDASLDALNASAVAVAQEKVKHAQPNTKNAQTTDSQGPKTKEITRDHAQWMLGLWP
jgi:hypothetical protein